MTQQNISQSNLFVPIYGPFDMHSVEFEHYEVDVRGSMKGKDFGEFLKKIEQWLKENKYYFFSREEKNFYFLIEKKLPNNYEGVIDNFRFNFISKGQASLTHDSFVKAINSICRNIFYAEIEFEQSGVVYFKQKEIFASNKNGLKIVAMINEGVSFSTYVDPQTNKFLIMIKPKSKIHFEPTVDEMIKNHINVKGFPVYSIFNKNYSGIIGDVISLDKNDDNIASKIDEIKSKNKKNGNEIKESPIVSIRTSNKKTNYDQFSAAFFVQFILEDDITDELNMDSSELMKKKGTTTPSSYYNNIITLIDKMERLLPFGGKRQ